MAAVFFLVGGSVSGSSLGSGLDETVCLLMGLLSLSASLILLLCKNKGEDIIHKPEDKSLNTSPARVTLEIPTFRTVRTKFVLLGTRVSIFFSSLTGQ